MCLLVSRTISALNTECRAVVDELKKANINSPIGSMGIVQMQSIREGSPVMALTLVPHRKPIGFGKLTEAEIGKLLKKVSTIHSLSMLRTLQINASELEDTDSESGSSVPDPSSPREEGMVSQRIAAFEERIRQRQQQLFESRSDTSFEDSAIRLSEDEFIEMDELVWSRDLLSETRNFLQELDEF